MGETLKPLFSWRGAICASGLAPATRHVALTLSLHMNELGGSAWPGPTLLAQETGLHVSTVKEKLAELERAGWLHCVERGGMKGAQRCPNRYEATFPDPVLLDVPVAVGDPSDSGTRRPGRGDPSPSPALPVAVGDPSSSRTLQENSSLDGDFDDWYETYPKKTEKPRGRANYKARRRSGVTHAELCAARDNYAAAVADRELRYVKSPAVFLEGKEGPWSEYVFGVPAHARGADLLGGAKAALKAMR